MKVLVTQTLLWAHGLQPTRLLCPWDFPGETTETQVVLNPATTPMMEGQMTLCPFFRGGIWDPEHRSYLFNLKTGKSAVPPPLSPQAPSSKRPVSPLSAPMAPPAEALGAPLADFTVPRITQFSWASVCAKHHQNPGSLFQSCWALSLWVGEQRLVPPHSCQDRSLFPEPV